MNYSFIFLLFLMCITAGAGSLLAGYSNAEAGILTTILFMGFINLFREEVKK